MALPTPPNSGKETIRHSFGAKDEWTAYTPLFSPIAEETRPSSPTDAILFHSRSSDHHQHHHHHHPPSPPTLRPPHASIAMKRSWSSEEARRDLQNDLSYDGSASKRQRFDTPQQYNGNRDSPLLSATSPPTAWPYSRTVRHVSPPSDEDVELFLWFVDEFPRAMLREQLPPQSPVDLSRKARRNKSATSRSTKKAAAREHVVKEEQEYRPTVARSRATPNHSRRRSLQAQTLQAKGDAKTTRSPANKALVSKDYRDWPDFSPSAHTLDNARSIADNMPLMSGRKDLSMDPLRDELHPVELVAANHAGIDCARYLCTKRSVFVGYLKHLLHKHDKRPLNADEIKKGLKSWNKTAAQNCSSIDVNKTSTLFSEFWTRLDWFNEAHFQQYLDDPASVKFPQFDKDGRLIN